MLKMYKVIAFVLGFNVVLSTASDWSYDGDTGPKNWPKKFKNCAGKRQSPIDISPNKTKLQKEKLQNNYNNQPDNMTFTLKNNGHSAQMDIKDATGLYSCVFGGKFKPIQVHFHWGRDDDVGSEHTVNGSQYSAEMHFVHMNNNYSSADEALKNQDGLLVLGTFIKVGIASSVLNPILDSLEEIENEGEMKELDNVDIAKLMPDNEKDFYFYDGSLTTPECNEAVKWIVFKDEISISSDQMEKLRSLKHEGDDELASMSNNFRPTQPLNGRTVKRTFSLNEKT